MPTPCTSREYEAHEIAVALIADVGPWRAALHVIAQAVAILRAIAAAR